MSTRGYPGDNDPRQDRAPRRNDNRCGACSDPRRLRLGPSPFIHMASIKKPALRTGYRVYVQKGVAEDDRQGKKLIDCRAGRTGTIIRKKQPQTRLLFPIRLPEADILVRLKGLEPTRLSTREPKSRMSANSITGAYAAIIIAPAGRFVNLRA